MGLRRLAFLVPWLLAGALPAAAKEVKPSNAEIAAFVKADANGDRVLSKPEFKVFVREMAKAGQSTARKIRFFGAYGYAFSIVDRNGDGRVTPKEMRSADTAFRAGR